jgi:hypothetical protein
MVKSLTRLKSILNVADTSVGAQLSYSTIFTNEAEKWHSRSRIVFVDCFAPVRFICVFATPELRLAHSTFLP